MSFLVVAYNSLVVPSAEKISLFGTQGRLIKSVLGLDATGGDQKKAWIKPLAAILDCWNAYQVNFPPSHWTVVMGKRAALAASVLSLFDVVGSSEKMIGRLSTTIEKPSELVEVPYRVGMFVLDLMNLVREAAVYIPRLKESRWVPAVLSSTGLMTSLFGIAFQSREWMVAEEKVKKDKSVLTDNRALETSARQWKALKGVMINLAYCAISLYSLGRLGQHRMVQPGCSLAVALLSR